MLSSCPKNRLRASFVDTAATLRQVKDLPLRIHRVPVEVKDLQGNGKIQTVNVRICQCRNGACLTKPWSASLGPMGWLALLLPLLLLLLLRQFLSYTVHMYSAPYVATARQ